MVIQIQWESQRSGQVKAVQLIDGEQVALVDGLDDGPLAVLLAPSKVGDHIGHADHRQGGLGLAAFWGEMCQIDKIHAALGPDSTGAVEHLTAEAIAEQLHGLAHAVGAVLPLLGNN